MQWMDEKVDRNKNDVILFEVIAVYRQQKSVDFDQASSAQYHWN